MAGGQGRCAWIATPGGPGVDEDLTQRAQYGAAGPRGQLLDPA
jgi:hypothetical protein